MMSARVLRHFALLAPVLAGPAHAADWDARFTNPKPADGDLMLPLPCGGSMAFRAVDVPIADGPLEDRPLTAGRADTESGYNDYVRFAYLAAPFPAPGGGRRFWIGKYPVTRDQFAALRQPPCPTPSNDGLVAQTSVSWPEAVRASSEWSGWLLAHARDKLPKRGEQFGYARLPTEDEWEYAARGGAKVSQEDFLAATWPMPEGARRYIYAGTQTAGGKAGRIGVMLPNPLGLYDMLGNASQMMLEPYRLNRVGRPHGQAGGIVLRGGNYTMQPDGFSTAMRSEMPPFDPATNDATRLRTVGFRLVISAPTVDGLQDTTKAEEQFDAIRHQGEQAADDPGRLIALLREQSADDAIKQGLDRVAAALASADRARTDSARVALGAQLEAGSVLAQDLWALNNTISVQERAIPDLPPDQAAQVRAAAVRRRADLQGSLDGYARLVRGIATGPAHDSIPATADVLRQEFTGRGQPYLNSFLNILTRQSTAMAAGQTTPRDQMLAQILAVANESARTQ